MMLLQNGTVLLHGDDPTAENKDVVAVEDERGRPMVQEMPAAAERGGPREPRLLRGLYSVVKDSDAHVRFSFLTGVSKFSKVSPFSGLNNVTDITLDPHYSAICGYTDGPDHRRIAVS